MKKLIASHLCTIFLGIFILISSFAKADSPLTSVEFYKAYEDVAIVKIASASEGQITQSILEYLDNPKNLIDIKMAVINALGWDFDGLQNAQLFYNYINRNETFKSIEEFTQNARPDQRLCYAYLLAMDNYFDVTNAASIASDVASLEKTASSYTYNMIAALINAQLAMDYDWCEVYHITNNVRQNTTLKKDFRMAAIPIIFEYMDLYTASCD
jgi:hypothetical protein